MGPEATRRTTAPAAGAVLVRREATDGWLRTLPAAPAAGITVSLTDPAAAIRHGAELAGLGYVPVGSGGCAAEGSDHADFLIDRELALAEEGWVRALLGPGGRLYQLAHVPAQSLLGPVLEAHGYRARTGTAR